MRDDFLSGETGKVSGVAGWTRALLRDMACDLAARAGGHRSRLPAAARELERRRVLVLAVERPDRANELGAAREELYRSRHAVSMHTKAIGDAGKFENLDTLLKRHLPVGHDWLIVIDDDVTLPEGFLDVFLFIAEQLGLSLVQPAHRWCSHAAWRVTRRVPGLVARTTRFVEIGPLFALHSRTFETLLPFPRLRYGWGLELHWSALAAEHGWRQGVIDATPVRHLTRGIASEYHVRDAVAEARAFLADRPYVTAAEAQLALSRHRRWETAP